MLPLHNEAKAEVHALHDCMRKHDLGFRARSAGATMKESPAGCPGLLGKRGSVKWGMKQKTGRALRN